MSMNSFLFIKKGGISPPKKGGNSPPKKGGDFSPDFISGIKKPDPLSRERTELLSEKCYEETITDKSIIPRCVSQALKSPTGVRAPIRLHCLLCTIRGTSDIVGCYAVPQQTSTAILYHAFNRSFQWFLPLDAVF